MPSIDDADGVLLIYTGGTIGSAPKDKRDPLSSLVPGKMEEIINCLPNYHHRDSKIRLGNHLVRLGAKSWADLGKDPIDSSNIRVQDWKDMCDVIQKHYREYEGFVILHGTDTMAYSASALAFMLDHLSKPVVITGSQLPIGSTRSDAVQNIVSSIELAAAKSLGVRPIPEVTVLFQNKVFRGCRLRKISASAFDGFHSPNLDPLCEFGEHITVRRNLVRAASESMLSVSKELEDFVISIDVFPGLKPEMLTKLLDLTIEIDEGGEKISKRLKGIVMKTFGTGNVPSAKDLGFLQPIEDAMRSRDDLMIVNVTQCIQGEVEQGLYDVSVGLLSCGVLSGFDMTPEAALTKMFVVLGKVNREEIDRQKAEDLMQLNLRGEQRISAFNVHFRPDEGVEIDKETKEWIVPFKKPRALFKQKADIYEGIEYGCARYEPQHLERAHLQIIGLRIPNRSVGRIEFKIYIDDPSADKESLESGDNFLGIVDKRFDSDKSREENVVIEITEKARKLISSSRKTSLTVVPSGGDDFALRVMRIVLHAAN